MSFRTLSALTALTVLIVPAVGSAQPSGEPTSTEPAAPTSSSEPGELSEASGELTAAPPNAPPVPAEADNKQDDPNKDSVEPSSPQEQPSEPALAGHFIVGLGVSMQQLHGRLGSDALARHWLGDAVQVDGDLSIGASRYVALGVFASYARYGAPSECSDCGASGFALGVQARYHLVQGTRFDPWLSAGAGYRAVSIQSDTHSDTASGIDVLDLRVGGDWYLAQSVGLGPFVGFTTGVFNGRARWMGEAELHWSLGGGVRVVLDRPGK